MKPYAEAVVDEAPKALDVWSNEIQHTAFVLVDTDEEVGDGRRGRHSHSNARLLQHDQVSETHAVVAHDDADGRDERLRRVVAVAAEGGRR